MKHYQLLSALLIFQSAFTLSVQAAYSGGAGTPADPYQIVTVADLITLSKTKTDWDGEYFLQTADIVFNSNKILVDWDNDGSANWDAADQLGFTPIGVGSYGAPSHFLGQYDGGNFKIKNLYIRLVYTATPPTADPHDVGLFGFVGVTGRLKNIRLENVNVTGGYNYATGALAGYIQTYPADLSVENCYSTGVVTGKDFVGGLIGYNDRASITNSYSLCAVTGTGGMLGGLIGVAQYELNLNNCFSAGNVSGASTTYNAGGLVGEFTGASSLVAKITNCYSTSNVSGNYNLGGLVGYLGQETTVLNCYSSGTVSGNSNLGGLVGRKGTTNVTISNSFWNTESSGNATSAAGTAITNDLMRTSSTFTVVSWDLSTIWNIQSGSPRSYPYLRAYTYDTPGTTPEVNPLPGLEITAVTWTGATSTDWNTATNWNPTVVPTSVFDATIPSGLTNYPVVSNGTNAAVKNLTHNATGKQITLDTGGKLTINGTYSPSVNSGIKMTGTTP